MGSSLPTFDQAPAQNLSQKLWKTLPYKLTMTSIAGDWEMVTDKCPVPVKVTLAELPGMWLMAAMIPKGNMIQCMLRKEGENFHLEKRHRTEKETPIEIVEMEMEVSGFLKKGVTKITREGGSEGSGADGQGMISLLISDL